MLQKRIFELRTACGYSQVELARRLGVSKQAVSNWENANILPSIEMLIRLADTFGVTTDYLLCRENLTTLNVEGLTPSTIAHISMLIEDVRHSTDNKSVIPDEIML